MVSRRLRLVLWSLTLAVFLASVLVSPARAASDPSLRWYTIETPHFRITYHSGLEAVAQHVADVAEGIHDTMRGAVGWTPREPTEIVLTDFSESANGSATALPYNAMSLLVTAPEDMSPLGDVDDWYYELVTHEYTHVLHTDQIRGLPVLVNAILGKTLAPNQVQPRWILEGLGVYQESARTSAGRLRNSQWDMFMRTDVLGDNLATLDQLSNNLRRWPQGNIFYLYGSFFTKWIAETYGEDALRKVADDYGKQLIPWGINRSIRRATGSTYEELYPAWIDSMRRHYGAQADKIRASGIREGARITHHGQITRYPRWIPKNAWPEVAGGLLYHRDDTHTRVGLWALPVERDARGAVVNIAANQRRAEHIARVSGESIASFDPDGGVVFGAQEFEKNVFLHDDLERLAPLAKSPFGTPDGGRVRLTYGLRAADPSVSPDGRRIVFATNRAGTRTIRIAELHDDRLDAVRPLVTTAAFEQAFTPRWSPDGTHVAYSVWKHGGYRDIRYVDVRDGTYRDVTNDRAVDGGPSFSADGRLLFFHSDRTSVMNLYAWDIAHDRLMQITNVVTGAYTPEPSPDGKTLAYVGYTTAGFDLFAMPIDETRWTDAEPYVDVHPPAPTVPTKSWEVRPYSAWRTLWPRRYGVQITEGSFGRVIGITASQADLTGQHVLTLASVTELEQPQPQGTLAYTYTRLPFDVGVSMFRSIAPRAVQLGPNYRSPVVQETTGFASSIVYSQPTPYDSRTYVVSHSLARTGADVALPKESLDPYETPALPGRGFTSTLHLGYSYTNAERYLYGVGAERGFSLSMAFDLTDPALGSDFSGVASSADLSVYQLMPWLSHHSVALHLGGGTSGGTFPGRGAFFVGSFVNLPVIDTVRNILIQGGVTLRGYPPVIEAGRSYLLGNLEYRFPIVNLDRGPSTLPFFLSRISGNAFFDYGSAFDVIDAAAWKSGTGLELWFDTILGYVVPFTFRVGYARGLASGGIDKTYFVAAFPY